MNDITPDETEQPGDEERRLISGQHEIIAAAQKVAAMATRELTIFSNQLAARLFETPEFLASLRKLAIATPHTRVRILVRLPSAAVVNAPQFLSLARQLSSSIEMKGIAAQHRHRQVTFIIADDRAVIYHPTPDAVDAVIEEVPGTAKHYLGVFNAMWEAGMPDPAIRTAGL